MMISAPISCGELIDKITILELKRELIQDPAKLINVNKELDQLTVILNSLVVEPLLTDEREALKAVNRELWHIENFKRQCEQHQRFDGEFVEAARQVYLKNDQRAEIKRQINIKTGSAVVEQKSY